MALDAAGSHTPSRPCTDHQDQSYCPVAQFIAQLVSLLSQSDSIEPQIIRHVKEILSQELNPILYPCVFEQIKAHTDQALSGAGYVNLSDSPLQGGNPLSLVEHIVYVMRNILHHGGWTKSIVTAANSGHITTAGVTTPYATALNGINIEPIIMQLCR